MSLSDSRRGASSPRRVGVLRPIVLRPIVLPPTSPAPTSFFVDGVRVCAVAPDAASGRRRLLRPRRWTGKPRGAFARRVASHVFGRRRDAREETFPDARSFAVDVPASVTATEQSAGGRRARVRIRVRVVEAGRRRPTRPGAHPGYSGGRAMTERRARVGFDDASRRSPARAATDRKIRWDIVELRTPSVTPEKSARSLETTPVTPEKSARSPASPHRPWSASFELALGRVSFLAQSSDARVGGFGVAGDETAALVTLAALRVSARTGPARDGFTALGVETSFESAHALDVSGTSAGEARSGG